MKVIFKPTGHVYEAERYSRVLPDGIPLDNLRIKQPSVLGWLVGKKPCYEAYHPSINRWIPVSPGDWFVYLSSGVKHLQPGVFEEFFRVDPKTKVKIDKDLV